MRINTVLLPVACLLCSSAALASHMASTSLATSSSSSINTESALPLDSGTWSFAMRYEQQRFDRLTDQMMLELVTADPAADLHSVESVQTTMLNVSYGLSENVSLGLSLPYVERHDIRAAHFHEQDSAFEIEGEGDSVGVGDAKLYGLWRFGQTESNSDALIFGIKTPTGKDDVRSAEGEVFEQEFQPGSGSWDPMIGVAYSHSFAQASLDTAVTYNLVNEGSQQTDLGDWLTYNVGLSHLLGSESNLNWRLVIEANGLWRDRQREAGDENRNSGGNWINLAPGIAVGGDNWSVFASLAFPVVNEPGGDQDKQAYRYHIGLQFAL